MAQGSLLKLDDYRRVAPRGTIDFLMRIGERLRGKRLVHVSASRYGGPVVEVLNRVVPLLNDLGVETTWEITIGTADFDQVTRAVGKALAGTEQVITELMLSRLRETGIDNAGRLQLDADLVVVHDAPPLYLVEQRKEASRWLWLCHHDLSSAQPQLWNTLRPVVQRYDASVFSLARFAAPLSIPRFIVYPSIDPLSERNREMTRAEQATVMDRLRVPRDKPILLQIGPFERQHDPLGVINAYRLVKKHHDVRLVLAGVGGAFGGREDLSVHVHACLLALRTGKPVKMSYGREESFYGHVHRHPARLWCEHRATRDGRITCVRMQILLDGGAYASSSTAVASNAASFALGPYRVDNALIEATAVYTNNPPCGAMRGFGAVQGCFAYEAQMDRLAAALEIDPVELRLLNALQPGDTMPTGQVVTGSLPVAEVIRRAAELPVPEPEELPQILTPGMLSDRALRRRR